MPTFRQLPTQMNTIPSISTIYYDRDHTHTRLDSDFKLHSRLPSLELAGLPLNGRPSVDSDLLNYSRSTFLAMPEDLQVQLKKILHLLGSKQHIVSHISHSVGLVNARGLAVGLEVGQIIADSFGEYVNIAQNLSNKLVKEELVGREEKISMLCKELSKLKHENAQLFENCRKLEEENTKYRRKIS